MSGTNGHFHTRYEVSMSGKVRDQLGSSARSAAADGQYEEFRTAYAEFLRRAASEPKVLGEPLRELRQMRLQLRGVLLGRLYVEYGVHSTAPVVLLRRIDWVG